MSSRRQAGFTLVELMIVVVILVILAGVGYPLYQDQVRKARRTDARTAAMQVALAQEQYYTRTGSYTSDLTDSELGLDAALQAGHSEKAYYDLAVAATTTSFSVTVTPASGKSQTHDGDCTSFVVNQIGAKSATGAHPNKCW